MRNVGWGRIEQAHQCVEIERLDHVRVEAAFARTAAVLVLTPAGEGDDHRFLAPGLLAEAARHLVPVELRQAEIEQHDVRPAALGDFERELPVGRRMDFMAAHLHERGQAVERVAVVVDNEDPPAGTGGASIGALRRGAVGRRFFDGLLALVGGRLAAVGRRGGIVQLAPIMQLAVISRSGAIVRLAAIVGPEAGAALVIAAR